jgi:endo-cleaving rubber dioxygenase
MLLDVEHRRTRWTVSAVLCASACSAGEPVTGRPGGGSTGPNADASTGSPEASTGSRPDGSSGSRPDGASGSPDSSTGSPVDVFDSAPPCPPVRAMFERDVQPALAYCRSCHVAGGVADTPLGSRFQLSKVVLEDESNLRASWERLGRNAPPKSLLLTMPSGTAGRTHTGGSPWPMGSAEYRNMDRLLASFADPSACDPGDAGGDAGPGWPLLGSARGGHVWSTYCTDRADDALLPVDPRTLVQPGVNAGKATYFNAHWVDCQKDAGPRDAPPRTCGEYRARYARGKALMEGGNMGFFAGSDPRGFFSIPALTYNDLWRVWGMLARPADFDERLANRWGTPLASYRNPYPLVGEDPNLTNGGSGQLPTALTQMREADGRYAGTIAFNCHWCHSGQVGLPSEGSGLGPMYGSNSLVELGAVFRDYFNGLGAILPIAANKTRGSGDILLYPAIVALDIDRASHFNDSLLNAPSGGTADFPTWWNVGHRTRRFHDGSFAGDDPRPVMGFVMPIGTPSRPLDLASGREWIEERDQDAQIWIEALRSPVYPGPIDIPLAEAGAILFHNKNLWAPELQNAVPRPPGGNGSCATCHGVYSPRFVHDARYLDVPALEGIAAYVVPLPIIDTDPARFNSLDEGLKDSLRFTWWAYGTNETAGEGFGAIEPGGYLAPPLYGIWASAPYFHNGSVPNLWEVLKPVDRKTIWRRVSAPAPSGDPGAFMGFDTSFFRAYDAEKLGWKYESIACGNPIFEPHLDCTPEKNNPGSQLWWAWNLSQPPLTEADLERRKIYNTRKYSQSNQGHAFTAVLTDGERKALLEYLKTL